MGGGGGRTYSSLAQRKGRVSNGETQFVPRTLIILHVGVLTLIMKARSFKNMTSGKRSFRAHTPFVTPDCFFELSSRRVVSCRFQCEIAPCQAQVCSSSDRITTKCAGVGGGQKCAIAQKSGNILNRTRKYFEIPTCCSKRDKSKETKRPHFPTPPTLQTCP